MVTTSRRARKKELTRAEIVRVGIDLFSRRGIDAVTVDQIAEAADVGKGTIYNYFQTKEDVVVAFMVDLERQVQARVSRSVSSSASAERVLTDFVDRQFTFKKPYHAFVRVFLGRMFLQTDTFLPYLVEMQKVIDPPLDALFRGLQQRGAIRADLDIPSLILAFKTVHLGLTAVWAIEGPPFRGTKQILATEMRLFCEGLVKP
jgi:AcrR family transcriptional regulator